MVKIDTADLLKQLEELGIVVNDPKGEKKEIELEFSHVHLMRRPQVVVRGYKT